MSWHTIDPYYPGKQPIRWFASIVVGVVIFLLIFAIVYLGVQL